MNPKLIRSLQHTNKNAVNPITGAQTVTNTISGVLIIFIVECAPKPYSNDRGLCTTSPALKAQESVELRGSTVAAAPEPRNRPRKHLD